MSTFIASLTGVGWVNDDHRHTDQLCFVFEEHSELCERPIAALGSLLWPFNPCPFADVGQIFDRNPAPCVFGLKNKSLANLVVHVFLETRLLSAQQLELASGRFRTLTLQFIAHPLMTLTVFLNQFAGQDCATVGDGDIRFAHIDAKETADIIGRWFFNVARRHQIELTVNQAKVRLAFLILQQFKLALTGNKGNLFSTVHCPEAHKPLVGVPFQDSFIVGNRAVGPEDPFGVLVKLVGIGHFGDTADHHLRSQIKGLTHGIVDKFLNLELSKSLGAPSYTANIVARGVRRLKRALQQFGLLYSWLELYLIRQFHRSIITHGHYSDKSATLLISQTSRFGFNSSHD